MMFFFGVAWFYFCQQGRYFTALLIALLAFAYSVFMWMKDEKRKP